VVRTPISRKLTHLSGKLFPLARLTDGRMRERLSIRRAFMREQARPSPSHPACTAGKPPRTAVDVVLRHARQLHRAAQSPRISSALPALRRIHAARVFAACALSTLYHERQNLKRKHFLRALAVEAGFATWEQFRPRLEHMGLAEVEHLSVADERFAFLNLWFSNAELAGAFAREHGGRVLRVDAQALVIAPDSPLGACAGVAR
jgi:hypothetical protein